MKPNWKNAPKWANYLAQDKNGFWFWHEYEPMANSVSNTWISKLNGRIIMAWNNDDSWKQTLEKRPEVK